MRRRTLLGSLGIAAAGGAVGSGAFTSVEATRTVNVAIADEDEALLALEPIDQELVNQQTRNEIGIDFDVRTDEGGRGVGSRSDYVFDGVFQIKNQGTQTVYVQSDFEEIDEKTDVSPGFYVATVDDSLLGEDAALAIEPGDPAAIGTRLDVDSVDVGLDSRIEPFSFDATITAEDEEPSGLTLLDNNGEEYNGEDGDREIG